MKIREKIQQELNRRLGEVKEFENKELISQELAKTFFARIADYLQYVKANKELGKFTIDLQNKRKELEVGRELLEKGEIILNDLRRDFKYTNTFLRRNSINIPTLAELFPSRYMGSVSAIGGIALDHHQIKTFLETENQHIGELPKNVRALGFLISRLKSMGKNVDALERRMHKYSISLEEYDGKLRLHEIYISFLRLADYEKLEDAWKLYYELDSFSRFSLLRLELGEIISENVGLRSLNTEQIRLLQKLQTEYLLHLYRFNNYLVDRLEEKKWTEEALYWTWDNFGKTFIGIWASLGLLKILEYFGINAPLDAIRSLLMGS